MKKYNITVNDSTFYVEAEEISENKYSIKFSDQTYTVSVEDLSEKEIASHIIGLESDTYYYTGEQIKPTVITDDTVILNRDYTVTYGDNIESGSGYVYINGIGEYVGQKTLIFNILNDPEYYISSHIIGITPTIAIYTGEEIKPTVNTDGTIEEDVNYTVNYENNIEPGIGKTTVTGIAPYYGTTEFDFSIVKDIEDHIIGIDPTTAVYTGEEIKPEVINDDTVALDIDYSVEYSDNIEIGTGKVHVEGINDYGGEVDFNFDIVGE